MALDEALLEAMLWFGQPVLRFYGWTEPAASFGYFQKFAEVERTTTLRPLVRRPTGGGIVPHDADWTYSLSFPTTHEWYSLPATESYRRVHEWIQAAFAKVHLETEISDRCKKSAPDQCFSGYEKSDLLWRERKIAGAAQRRTRAGLLVQGSVQPPAVSVSREDWHQAMRETAVTSFGADWNAFEPDSSILVRAETLAVEKYGSPAYNRKR